MFIFFSAANNGSNVNKWTPHERSSNDMWSQKLCNNVAASNDSGHESSFKTKVSSDYQTCDSKANEFSYNDKNNKQTASLAKESDNYCDNVVTDFDCDDAVPEFACVSFLKIF